MQAEIEGVLNFIHDVYLDKFNMTYLVALSTRPAEYMGSLDQWNQVCLSNRSLLH